MSNFEEHNVENLIIEMLKELEVKDYAIKIASGSSKGDGFSGVIFNVNVEGKLKSEENVEYNFLVKSSAKNEAFRKQAPLRTVYQRESDFYTIIFPALNKFQMEKGLKNPFTSVAKCYTTRMEENAEALVFENLRYRNYDLWDRKRPMDENHIKLALKQYGKFHALSFALRDQKPEVYKKLTCDMGNPMIAFQEQTSMVNSLKTLHEEVTKVLEKNNDIEAVATYKPFKDQIKEVFVSTPSHDDPYSSITHGDCWCNNMMFKYKDSVPTEICFLDWQICRIASPVHDLSYFFYTTCSKESLDNLKYYQSVYYESFSSFLKELGSDPDKLFPFAALETQWKKYARYGLIMATMVIRVIVCDKEEIPDIAENVKDGKDFIESFIFENKNADEYHKRIRDIVLHFVENKFI